MAAQAKYELAVGQNASCVGQNILGIILEMRNLIILIVVACLAYCYGRYLQPPKVVTVRKVVMFQDQGEGIGIPWKVARR